MTCPDEATLKAALIEGWTWLWDNCEEGIVAHEECGSFEQRWFEKLREYERCHGGSGTRDGRMGPGWGAGRVPQEVQQEMFAEDKAARDAAVAAIEAPPRGGRKKTR